MNSISLKGIPLNMRWIRVVAAIALILAAAAGGLWLTSPASEPRGAESSSGGATPVKRSAQPVRVTSAERGSIQAWVFAEGTARSVSRQYLTFDRAGRVTYVKPGSDGGDLRAGESVAKGEVLARLDRRQYESEIDSTVATVEEAKTQLEVAQTEIHQAETQRDLATAKFRRTEQLLRDRATSRAEYEEVEANLQNAEAALAAARAKVRSLEAGVSAAEARLKQSRLALDETEIVSPIDGIIAYLNIEEGFYFTQSNIRTTSESEALQTIPIVVIDPSQYEITVDIPSYEAVNLARGQEVLLIPGGMAATSAFDGSRAGPGDAQGGDPNWQARGTVFSINPAVNPGGRSVQIKVRTEQGARQLRDGMFVTCWIKVQDKPDAIVAPFDAFLFEENRPYVFVVDRQAGADAAVARRVDVRVGIESLTTREILLGVADGEQLVTDGRYRLVDGAPVKIVGTTESRVETLPLAERSNEPLSRGQK